MRIYKLSQAPQVLRKPNNKLEWPCFWTDGSCHRLQCCRAKRTDWVQILLCYLLAVTFSMRSLNLFFFTGSVRELCGLQWPARPEEQVGTEHPVSSMFAQSDSVTALLSTAHNRSV